MCPCSVRAATYLLLVRAAALMAAIKEALAASGLCRGSGEETARACSASLSTGLVLPPRSMQSQVLDTPRQLAWPIFGLPLLPRSDTFASGTRNTAPANSAMSLSLLSSLLEGLRGILTPLRLVLRGVSEAGLFEAADDLEDLRRREVSGVEIEAALKRERGTTRDRGEGGDRGR